MKPIHKKKFQHFSFTLSYKNVFLKILMAKITLHNWRGTIFDIPTLKKEVYLFSILWFGILIPDLSNQEAKKTAKYTYH